jgi:hypothetical protein
MHTLPTTTDADRFSTAARFCEEDGPPQTVHAFGAKWVITARPAVWHTIALEPSARLPEHWWTSQAFLAGDEWFFTYRTSERERLIRMVCREGAEEVRDIRAERRLQAEFADTSWWIGRTPAALGRRWMARRDGRGTDPPGKIVAPSAAELGTLLRAALGRRDERTAA